MTDPELRQAFAPLRQPLMALSKCPDFVVNRGHYFGTAQFNQGVTQDERAWGTEAPLSDADKRALIAYLDHLLGRTAMSDDVDYIVVGSGAGGGTLAARLAEAGMYVLLLEAGHDPRTEGSAERFPGDYDIPAFHAFASENPAMAWDFFVEHYADEGQAARDPKRVDKGVLYPRAGTLGGCTAHNAMIFVTAQPCDWDALAKETGDSGWSAANMAHYQRKVESCRHRPVWRLLDKLGITATRARLERLAAGGNRHAQAGAEGRSPAPDVGDGAASPRATGSAACGRRSNGCSTGQLDPNDRAMQRGGGAVLRAARQ